MLKVQFGCGGNKLDGWQNHDIEVDITKPLPYDDNSVDFIFSEHVIEHVIPADAYRFFKECLRVLKPFGVMRVAFPDLFRILINRTTAFDEFHKNQFGFKDGIESIICGHEHKAIWTEDTMAAVLGTIGYSKIKVASVNHSTHLELFGLERHGSVIGIENNVIETSVLEATK
jgi:predicted SAM-dependent methyltransferase